MAAPRASVRDQLPRPLTRRPRGVGSSVLTAYSGGVSSLDRVRVSCAEEHGPSVRVVKITAPLGVQLAWQAPKLTVRRRRTLGI